MWLESAKVQIRKPILLLVWGIVKSLESRTATKNQGAGGVAAYLGKRVWGWGEPEKRTRGQ